MTNRQAWGVFSVGVLTLCSGLLVLWQACVTACTPAEEQSVARIAQDTQAPLGVGCTVVETLDAASWIDYVCASAEAADALLARLPLGAAKGIAPDGGGLVPVRAARASFAGDP